MNKKEKAERERLYKIYSILVSDGGACEHMRGGFIESHLVKGNPYPCYEWRFSGKLLFGGKYRRERNTVDYYSEDYSPERDAIAKAINEKLALI